MGIKICPFNKMLSRFSAFLNYRDHRKYIIIDGKIGYSGGINLADEYDLIFRLELNNMYSNKITCICVSMEVK